MRTQMAGARRTRNRENVMNIAVSQFVFHDNWASWIIPWWYFSIQIQDSWNCLFKFTFTFFNEELAPHRQVVLASWAQQEIVRQRMWLVRWHLCCSYIKLTSLACQCSKASTGLLRNPNYETLNFSPLGLYDVYTKPRRDAGWNEDLSR